MASQRWQVVGGADKGGIIVRAGQSTQSEQLAERLSTGALVRQLELVGERLSYELLSGSGPATGWASLSLKDKSLLVRVGEAEAGEADDDGVAVSDAAAAAAGSGSGSGSGAACPAAATAASAQLTLAAEGVWEATAWDSAKHDEVFAFVYRGCNKSLKPQAEALNTQFQAGTLPPCVYVERMVLLAMPRGGGILVYSPIPITPELRAAVDERGGCKAIVVPTSEHALHHQGWMEAFPQAVVVCPGGDSMAPVLAELGEAANVLDARARGKWAKEAVRVLTGFSYDVMDVSGFQEVLLLHRQSRTLLTCDSIYIGCADKADPAGWKNFPAPEWRKLYFDAYCEKSSTMLPTYRMLISAEDKQLIAKVMQKVLEWKVERVTSARSGKTTEGGQKEAEAVLRGHWAWCFVP